MTTHTVSVNDRRYNERMMILTHYRWLITHLLLMIGGGIHFLNIMCPSLWLDLENVEMWRLQFDVMQHIDAESMLAPCTSLFEVNWGPFDEMQYCAMSTIRAALQRLFTWHTLKERRVWGPAEAVIKLQLSNVFPKLLSSCQDCYWDLACSTTLRVVLR